MAIEEQRVKMPSLIVTLFLLLALPAWAKPPAAAPVHAADSANLRRAKATVDKLTSRLSAMVKQAEAPGMDVAKVQALLAEFQTHVASQRQESDAVEKLLTDDEKSLVGTYIAEKVSPLLARFELVYKRVQDEADPQREERQKALLASLETASGDANKAVQSAKEAGKDPALRAAVAEKLDQLNVAQHAIYHTAIAALSATAAREQWENLFAERLERPLLRAERLLRMTLQTPSPEYQKATGLMADLSKQADLLHGEWHALQEWSGLKALQDRETALQSAVQGLAKGWRLLAADEAMELDAVARETLVPAMERMSQESAEARKRLPPEATK